MVIFHVTVRQRTKMIDERGDDGKKENRIFFFNPTVCRVCFMAIQKRTANSDSVFLSPKRCLNEQFRPFFFTLLFSVSVNADAKEDGGDVLDA